MQMDLDKIRKEAFSAGHAYAWGERVVGKPTNWVDLYNKWIKEESIKNNVTNAGTKTRFAIATETTDDIIKGRR